MYKIAVLSSTRGTNLQSFVDAIKEGSLKNAEIACVISNKPDCGAVQIADINNIPVHLITSSSIEERDQDMLDALRICQAELVVMGGYLRLVGSAMLEAYENRIINIHPSLLPKFGGGMDTEVHQAVLRAGEKESGMTIHFVDEGIDTGDIILQKYVKIDDDETPESLKKKVQRLEREWYPKVIQMFADGEINTNT